MIHQLLMIANGLSFTISDGSLLSILVGDIFTSIGTLSITSDSFLPLTDNVDFISTISNDGFLSPIISSVSFAFTIFGDYSLSLVAGSIGFVSAISCYGLFFLITDNGPLTPIVGDTSLFASSLILFLSSIPSYAGHLSFTSSAALFYSSIILTTGKRLFNKMFIKPRPLVLI